MMQSNQINQCCFTTNFEEVLYAIPNLSCWLMQLKSLMSFRMISSCLLCNGLHYNKRWTHQGCDHPQSLQVVNWPTDLLVTISADQAWVRSGWVKRKIFVSNCHYFEDNHGWIIFKTNVKVTEAFLLNVIGIWPCCISQDQFRPCQWWRFIWFFDKID